MSDILCIDWCQDCGVVVDDKNDVSSTGICDDCWDIYQINMGIDDE